MDKREILASLIESANILDEKELPDEANVLTKIAQTIFNPDEPGSDYGEAFGDLEQMPKDFNIQPFGLDDESDTGEAYGNEFEEQSKMMDSEAELKEIVKQLFNSGQPIDPTVFDTFKSVLGDDYVNQILQETQFSNELQDSGVLVQ